LTPVADSQDARTPMRRPDANPAKRLGLVVPHIPLAELPAYARRVADLGYHDLWAGESDRYDGCTPLALAAAVEPRLRLGNAVLPVQTRGRFLMAQTARSLESAAPGRFILGLGASSPFIVEWWNGLPYGQPLAATRELVAYIRERHAKDKVRVPIYIGALGPRMLALAAEIGDGVVLTSLAARDIPTVTRGLRFGEVVVWVPVMVAETTEQRDDAVADARRRLAPYMRTPAYAAHHARLGRVTDPLDDDAIHDLMVIGSAAECRRRITEFYDHGADTVIVELFPGLGDPSQISPQAGC